LVAQFAIFFQQFGGDPAEIRNEIRVQPQDWHGRPIQDRLKYNGSSPSTECQAAGSHFVQHGAEREKIAALVKFFSAGLLGRHICNRAHGDPGTG
jgi:hypothetical protein